METITRRKLAFPVGNGIDENIIKLHVWEIQLVTIILYRSINSQKSFFTTQKSIDILGEVTSGVASSKKK